MHENVVPQAIRSQRTRDDIVQAALTVFALKGFSAASMDDVSLAAGCSKGGLYHHFKTKSAVLSEVVEHLIQVRALLPPFASTSGVLRLSSDALGRVLIEIWAEAARSSDLRAQLKAGYEAHLDRALRDGGAPSALAEILRVGAIIQLLARGDTIDTGAAAARLGIAA